jgi:hypothetical protein
MALESAWCRWRNTHGLAAADPLPPVSSYVGYSLDAPWGQPRVVLGLCAEEAEQLAVLLDRHDCVGPVHASVTAKSASRWQGGGAPGQLPAGLVHVPAPSPASAGQQARPASPAYPSQDQAPATQRHDVSGPSALTAPSAPGTSNLETPIALAASRAVEASMASRKTAMNGSPGPRAHQSGESASSEQAPDGDDHPCSAADPAAGQDRGSAVDQDRGSPAAGSVAGDQEQADKESADKEHADSKSAPQPRPGQPGWLPARDTGEDDAAAVTALGGLPSVPAIQPFAWAGGLAHDNGRRPVSRPQEADRAGEAGRPDADKRPRGDGPRGDGPRGETHRGDGPRGDGPRGDGPRGDRPRDETHRGDRHPGGGANGSGTGQGSGSAGPGGGLPAAPGYRGAGQGVPAWGGTAGDGEPYPAAEHQAPASPASSPGRNAADARHPDGNPSRPNRMLRGPSLARLKRPGQASGGIPAGPGGQLPASAPRDNRDHVPSGASADAATWAASELPGQAAVTDTAV